MYWKLDKIRGYTLFEFSLVLPVLLAFILGTVDVATLIQGYSALKQGVNSALRCVYPTDAACVSTTSETREKRFAVYLRTGGITYLGDEFQYGGTAAWLAGPRTIVRDIQVTTLGNLTYDLPIGDRSERKDFFAATATPPRMVMLHGLPYLTGDPLEPRFKASLSPDVAFPETGILTRDISSISHGTTSSAPERIGRMTFSLPAPYSGNSPIDCIRIPPSSNNSPGQIAGGEIDWKNVSACDLSWPATSASGGSAPLRYVKPNGSDEFARFTYVVLAISGHGVGATPGAIGRIGLSLRQGDSIRPLGGRTFSGPGPANFVPRGVPKVQIDGTTLGEGYREEFEAHEYLRVEYDKPFTVEFTLESLNGGQIGWQGDSIQLYFPEYVFDQSPISCANLLTRTETDDACQLPYSFVSKGAVSRNPNPVKSERIILGCNPPLIDTTTAFRQRGIPDPEDFIEESTCDPKTLSRECPPAGAKASNGILPNFGVKERADATTGLISNSSDAAKMCPPPSELENGSVSNLRWSERIDTIHLDPAFEHSVTDCDHRISLPSEYPELISHYPKVVLGQSEVEASVPIYTGSTIDPGVIKSREPKYQCDDITVERNEFGVSRSTSKGSLFTTPHFDLGCAWEGKVRSEALEEGLDPNAYFVASRTKLGETEIPGPATDVCTAFRIGTNPGATEIPLGTFSESALPVAPCLVSGSSCREEFAGFSSGGGTPSSTKFDFEKAAGEFGLDAVRSGYPRAHMECNGSVGGDPHCLAFDIREDGHEVVAHATLDVPLALYFGRSARLSFTGRRMLEKEFIK